MNILILGAPGSGKDTQAEILAAHYGFEVVSSGTVLRAKAESNSNEVTEIIEGGGLVDDETVFRVLEEYVRSLPLGNGIIFTGAVRKIEQAYMLDEMLATLGTSLDKVIFLELDDKAAAERMRNRGREEEIEEVIKNRFRIFHEENDPILEEYEKRGILLRVDASPSIKEISEAIKKKLGLIMNNDIEVKIKELILSALKSEVDADISLEDIHLEHPADFDRGDWATNVAMRFAKDAQKSPRDLAQVLIDKMILDMSDDASALPVDSIEVAGPGFLNFKISQDHYLDVLQEIVTNQNFGWNSFLEGQKVIVEFTDPNPFKEFHVGHLYSNSFGESVGRIIEAQGADLKRANYQGDVGLHVAKSIWGMRKKLAEDNKELADLEKEFEAKGDQGIREIVRFLGQSYALGATAYLEDPKTEKEIKELNTEIFERRDSMEIYIKGREWSLEYFEWMYQRLGTVFDFYFFESEVEARGKALVEKYLGEGLFESSDGAVIFPGEKYGLHNRVFINSYGLPTYEAKELGLAIEKYERFEYNQSIVITGNDINDYFQVLLEALSHIRPDLAEKTTHIGHGIVRLPDGKMSSRTGKIVTGEWLLDKAKELAEEKIAESKFDANEKDELAEMIAVGAVKYALLRHSVGGNIEFDFEESISFEGNSGPYLQYTAARARSIVNKLSLARGEQGQGNSVAEEVEMNAEEAQLARWLARFPEVVHSAGSEISPHLVANYLFELAQLFNTFYNKHQILDGDEPISEMRVLLTRATAQIISSGLFLLGIKSPERM